MENSKQVGREQLSVPEFIFNQKGENFKDIVSQFYDQILSVYEEFSDFKINKCQNDLGYKEKR